MRKRIFLLVLLTALILALAACGKEPALLTGDDISDIASDAAPPQEEPVLDYSSALQDEAGQHYANYNMTVPHQVYDAFSPAAALAVSNDLMDFASMQSRAWQDDQAALHEAEVSLDAEFTLDVSLFYQDEDIVSLTGQGYSYTSGAAHPDVYAYGFVYDRATGSRIGIEQLLGEDWQDKLFGQIYQQIVDSGDLPGYFQDVETALHDSFRQEGWYADGDYIYVVYPTAAIAPYAAGTPTFSVPR